MRVTLKQIAEKAGVHISTVDKVIHNRGGVSTEVADRIRDIIEELDYRPNPTGRALQKSRKRYRIAVLLIENDAVDYLRQGVHEELSRLAFQVDVTYVVTGVLDSIAQCRYIEQYVREGYDGIIILPIYSDQVAAAMDAAMDAGVAVVTVNSDVKGSKSLCHIGQYGAQEAAIAGKVMGLLLQGRGKIAIVTGSIHPDSCDYNVKTRESGFTEYLSGHFPEIEVVRVIECFENRVIARKETQKLLREAEDLDGIYITCGCVDTVAEEVVKAGKQGRIHLVGYEDFPEIISLIKDGVIDCSIGGGILEQGRMSIRIIMDYLVHGKKPDRSCYYMDVRILFRECICAPDA